MPAMPATGRLRWRGMPLQGRKLNAREGKGSDALWYKVKRYRWVECDGESGAIGCSAHWRLWVRFR